MSKLTELMKQIPLDELMGDTDQFTNVAENNITERKITQTTAEPEMNNESTGTIKRSGAYVKRSGVLVSAAAIAVVAIGGAASELAGAVVLVPSQSIAVDIEVVGIPSVLPILGAVFVLEIAALVEGDGVDADELTATVTATVEVVGVFNHVYGIAVDAHFLTGRFAGFIAGKGGARNQQNQR